MTDVSFYSALPSVAKQQTVSLPTPAPVPFGAPVFISDCASPLAGDTVLGLILKRLDDTTRPDDRPGRDGF